VKSCFIVLTYLFTVVFNPSHLLLKYICNFSSIFILQKWYFKKFVVATLVGFSK